MASSAVIELRDFLLKTDIGTYADGDVVPDEHVLDMTLGIAVDKLLIDCGGMEHVFDYDPLITEIERLAADGHYATQERLVTRIATACASYPAIERIEIGLKKRPVRQDGGSLGVRLTLDAAGTDALRPSHARPAR